MILLSKILCRINQKPRHKVPAAANKNANINEHTKIDLSARRYIKLQQIVFLIGVPPSLRILPR